MVVDCLVGDIKVEAVSSKSKVGAARANKTVVHGQKLKELSWVGRNALIASIERLTLIRDGSLQLLGPILNLFGLCLVVHVVGNRREGDLLVYTFGSLGLLCDCSKGTLVNFGGVSNELFGLSDGGQNGDGKCVSHLLSLYIK